MGTCASAVMNCLGCRESRRYKDFFPPPINSFKEGFDEDDIIITSSSSFIHNQLSPMDSHVKIKPSSGILKSSNSSRKSSPSSINPSSSTSPVITAHSVPSPTFLYPGHDPMYNNHQSQDDEAPVSPTSSIDELLSRLVDAATYEPHSGHNSSHSTGNEQEDRERMMLQEEADLLEFEQEPIANDINTLESNALIDSLFESEDNFESSFTKFASATSTPIGKGSMTPVAQSVVPVPVSSAMPSVAHRNNNSASMSSSVSSSSMSNSNGNVPNWDTKQMEFALKLAFD